MPFLDIIKVVNVKEQSGEPGGDELYFTVNGVKVGPTPSLSTGESHTFPYKPVWFSGTANVHLYEEDGFLNPDDYVDSAYISSTPVTNKLEWMDGSGGWYDVYYSVIA